MAILKVFARKPDRKSILEKSKLIGDYDAFVVVDAPDAAARALSRVFPVEDISDQYRISLAGVDRDPLARPAMTATATVAALRRKPAATLGAGPHHYIVQFIGPIKPAWMTALRQTGVTVRQPFGGFAYVVRADDAMVEKLRGLKMVRWVGHLPHADRVAPGLEDKPHAAASPMPRRRVLPGVLSIEVFGAENVATVAAAAQALGFKLLHADKSARVVTLESDGTAANKRERVRLLSAVHGVRFIRERVLPRTSNNVATGIMNNAFTAVTPTGLKLAGEGEVIAICDTGLDSGEAVAIHPDFAGRVLAIKSYPIAPEWADYVTNPGGNDGGAVTLPPKNVPLAECFNASKEDGNDEDSAGALHAGIQARGGTAGDRRAEHRGGGQVAGRGRADAVQLGQG